jgi:hypothetical protein
VVGGGEGEVERDLVGLKHVNGAADEAVVVSEGGRVGGEIGDQHLGRAAFPSSDM